MNRQLVAACFALLAGAADADDLSRERAVEVALERNPELAALAGEVRAAEARLSGARLLLSTNPEISVAAGPRRTESDRSTDLELELTQRVEVSGQRGARIDAAIAEREAAAARLGARRVELAASVRVAHARALAAERLVALAREDLGVTRDAVRSAEKRAELGNATRLEVNAARTELGRAARAVGVASTRLAAALSELRLLLALEPGGELVPGGALPTASEIRLQPVEAIAAGAVHNRSDLLAARREVAAAEAEGRLAGREAFPSPVLGARYSREERAEILLGTVSFDLPFFNRNQGSRGVAAARTAQSSANLSAVARRIDQEVRLAAVRLESALEAARAFDLAVVAGAEENLALSTRAYEAGKIGLAELLLMRRSAVEARRDEIDARQELASAEAELARAAGSERLLTRDPG